MHTNRGRTFALLGTILFLLTACNGLGLGSDPGPQIEQITVYPQTAWRGLHTRATIDIRLNEPLPRKTALTADTSALDTTATSYAYRDAEGRPHLSCNLFLDPALPPGVYPVPLTLSDRRGRSITADSVITIAQPRPAAPVILTPGGRATIESLTGTPLTHGNRITFLEDGPAAFETWLDLLEQATRQINIQTYFMEDEGLSAQIIDALCRKAAAGVEVNILICRYSQLGKAPLTPLRLRQNGARVILAGDIGFPGNGKSRSLPWLSRMLDDYRIYRELPPQEAFGQWSDLEDNLKIDYALHEKMLIVDGSKAITGGRNISDSYFWWWHDLDLLVEGPLVAQLQAAFATNWAEFNGREAFNPLPYQPADPPGGVTARMVQSRPWHGEYYNLDMLCAAIDMARDRVCISSQYLALPPRLEDALTAAARRGVDVRILTNSLRTGQEVAHALCHFISLNHYRDLLQGGVRIYEYYGTSPRERFQPYLHTKEFIIDGVWLSVGSFNLSIRSAYLESELMITIPDPAIAAAREDAMLDCMAGAAVEVNPHELGRTEERFALRMNLARNLEILY